MYALGTKFPNSWYGDKEMKYGQVNVRVRGQEKAEGSVVDAFVDRMKKLIVTKKLDLLAQSG